MMGFLGNLGSQYQDAENARLYGPNPMGGFPFNFMGRPGEGAQRSYIGDLATGKKDRFERQNKMAGEALLNYIKGIA